MPFGLTNAPATSQMTVNEAFRLLLDKCVIVYLDNILINSTDRAQHLRDIEAVFKLLSENSLLTKTSKCEFLQDRLEFLGHVISADGVEIDPKKFATIQAWHAPTNLTELQSFLGFVNYVRWFVPDMAKLTAPLTDLLRKGVEYTWGEKEQVAFSALKNILCSPPVLRIADPHRPFELVNNASDIVVGAVLLQDFGNGLQPIAYESRKLHPPERNYPIHDCEMRAIVHALLPHRSRRDSTDRPSCTTVPSRPIEPQSATDSLVRLSRVQIPLHRHVQKRRIKYRQRTHPPYQPTPRHPTRPDQPTVNRPIHTRISHRPISQVRIHSN
ncbi:unnamed protein product [Closterium sp. NIES-53]